MHGTPSCWLLDRLSRQPPGLGPAFDLPLTTMSSRPSRATATAFGYQPVGINPITAVFAGNPAASSSSAGLLGRRASSSVTTSRPSCSTATELRPPLVTNNVRLSPESARLFGFAPLSPAGLANTDA